MPENMRRTLAMTRNGRFVVFCKPDGVHVVDAAGPLPRRTLAVEPAAFACIGDELWLAAPDGSVSRMPLDGSREASPVAGTTCVTHIIGVAGAAILAGTQRAWLVE